MLEKIRKIHLYVGKTQLGESDGVLAKEWLDTNEIPYSYLWYGDPAQHPEVFAALATWPFGIPVEITDFPFVIYNEMHENGDVIAQCLYGLDAIVNSNLKELVELG
jgi:hypothetical protein